jgi:hypothetical protein
MAKKQDFASKASKMAKHGKTCPVCGEFFLYVRTVDMTTSKKEGAYRFAEKNVGVCKCNEKEIYG